MNKKKNFEKNAHMDKEVKKTLAENLESVSKKLEGIVVRFQLKLAPISVALYNENDLVYTLL